MDKKKILIIAVAVLLVVGIAVGALFFINSKKNKDDEVKEIPIEYKEYMMESQLANILTPENSIRKSIVKYTLSIQYTDPELEKTLQEKDSELKNEFRKYFMSKNTEQLQRIERIQEDLVDIALKVVNVESDKITNVFLTEFIIQ